MIHVRITTKRPPNVTAIGILVMVGAILQFLAATSAVVLALRSGAVQHLFGASVSDWYWITSAILSLILGLIYVWIAKGVFGGNSSAWMLVNLLAIINLVFAMFQIPFGTGWATIFLNAIILLMNNTASARAWFRTD